MAEAAPLPGPWGHHPLAEDEERTVDVGPLRLHLRRTKDEIWLAHEALGRDGEASIVAEALTRGGGRERSPSSRSGGGIGDERESERGEDGEIEWSRWAVPSPSDPIRLMPAFPDRPVVVEPDGPFHLARRARVRVYVRVPLHVRIGTGGAAEPAFARIPTVTLSDTWFGDFQEGELCYFLPTTARREIGHEHFAPHLAACPLELSNRADEELKVEKLALRVAHLSLFSREGDFWSDQAEVGYRGADLGSDLRMSGKPPAEAPEARLVVPPEVPAETGFRARTFARRIVQLPGFGSGG